MQSSLPLSLLGSPAYHTCQSSVGIGILVPSAQTICPSVSLHELLFEHWSTFQATTEFYHIRGVTKYFSSVRAVADPGSGQGGQRFFPRFCRRSKVSQYWPGSRARLRALEALTFLTLKYAFSYFSGNFSSNFYCSFVWVHHKISI